MQTIQAYLLQTVSTVKEWWNPADFTRTVPPETWPLQNFYLGFIALCLVLGITVWFLPLHHTLRSRFSSFFWTNVTIGVILFIFRKERLPVLGMDMWRFLQEVIALVVFGSIAYYWKKKLPQVVLKEQIASYKSKYLPKPKK